MYRALQMDKIEEDTKQVSGEYPPASDTAILSTSDLH